MQETLPPEMEQDAGETEITQLRGECESLGKHGQDHSQSRGGQETHVSHWKQDHPEAHQSIRDLQNQINALEKEVCKATEECEVQARNHFAMIHQLNSDHREELLKQRKRIPIILQENIEYYQERDRKRQHEAEDTEDKAKKLSQELEKAKAKLIITETRIQQLSLGQGDQGRKNHDLLGRVNALRNDKSSLQKLVNDTKRSNDILKDQHSEERKRAQAMKQEMLGLRHRLAGQETARKTKAEEAAAQALQLQSLEVELEKATLTIKYFERALLNKKLAISKLEEQNKSLINNLEKGAQETKTSTSGFGQLVHDTAENEAKLKLLQ